MKIAICFGTRPEIIKMALLTKKMSERFDVVNIFTGQHHSLYEDVKHLIPKVDFTLPLTEYKNINIMYSDLTKYLCCCFENCKPDLVIVQGDTASSYCASFCAFMMGIKVGHVEAGLRTYNIRSPFPEEFNRQVISKIAYYNWCPSAIAVDNLKKEFIKGVIILTGNTIVDFIYGIFGDNINSVSENNTIIVTLHRRENADNFSEILKQINDMAISRPDMNFVFPAHPNPMVQNSLDIISAKNFKVVKPMKYEDFLKLLKSCAGIITDSGGIQEEAVCLKKRVLVCRNTTERKEAIMVGISRLVGNDVRNNFDWMLESFDKSFENPYGDGHACNKIINSLEEIK